MQRQIAIRHVLETCVYAHDLEAAERFYGVVLGLARISRRPARHVFFRCGEGVFLVFNPVATSAPSEGRGAGPDPVGNPIGDSDAGRDPDVPLHGALGPGHAAFAVPESDLPAWRERLARHGVAVEAEVEWPGGGRSLYLRDPAGNSVELASPAVWGNPDTSAGKTPD